MKEMRNKIKIMCYIGAVILLFIISFLSLVSIVYGDESGQDEFILPSWGGGMVHCDPQMSDNIRLPVPIINVGKVWYRHDLGGELFGTFGIGIAGNNKIAANTFHNFLWFTPLPNSWKYNSFIIYDYYGNHIWSDSQLLNPTADSSTPMIDIDDKVVACDNQKIILVNASNRSNVHVEWENNFSEALSLFDQVYNITISPNIVENRTIILPTFYRLYAFDVKTGCELANITFSDNSNTEPFYGIREMNWSDFTTIMSNPLACPYHYNSSSQAIEWNSTVPYGIMPMTPIFYEGNIMFMTDRDGIVSATDMTNGSIMAINSLGTPELVSGERLYRNENAVCVQGNRTYILTTWTKPGFINRNTSGRLWAVDVNPDAQNPSDILKIVWNYSFPGGQSQASPTLINDTLYFDGYNGPTLCKIPPPYRDPHIYAVYTNGTERWNVSYDNITGFSFSMDPRGGFWYEDLGLEMSGGGGRKLVRFSEENGSIIEEINVSELFKNITQKLVYPCSCMTICGTATHPIMIVSINHALFVEGKWVVAINLSYNNNSLLWKVPIKSLSHMNYAGGQYTILKENNESRILFGTWLGGVMAIGSYPDCWFDGPINYQFSDSSNDMNTFKDTVNVSFTLKTSLSQDKATVRVILHPRYLSNPFHPCYPILYRYRAEKEFIVTPEGTSGSIELSLPPGAPEGKYAVHVVLLNSSGDIIIDTLDEILGKGLEKLSDLLDVFEYDYDVNLTEKLEKYSTEISNAFHVNILELLNRYPLGVIKNFLLDILSIYVLNDDKVDPYITKMYPLNDPPDNPEEPDGPPPPSVYAGEEYEYKTRTYDPNGDDVEYKWRFNFGDLLLNYKKWSEPCNSGEYHKQKHSWITWGPRLILVKARDIWHSPNVQSGFSDPKEVWVLPHSWFSAPSEQIVGEPVQFNGYSYGAEASQWLWDFDLSKGFEVKNSSPVETYNESGTYTVLLKVIDTESNTYTFSREIDIKYLIANFTSHCARSNETLWFNDTSLVHNDYNIINRTWDFGDGNVSYEEQNVNHSYTLPGVYNVILTIMDDDHHIDGFSTKIIIDDDPPVVLDAPPWLFRVKPGHDVIIYADVVDGSSGVCTVTLNISLPDSTWQEVTMEQSDSSPYDDDYEYVFSDTDTLGEYFYSITAEDNAGNHVYYAGFSFLSSPLIFGSITPYYGAISYGYVPVEVDTLETMQHYSFTNFNNDVTVWMPMDVITDDGQPVDVSGYENTGTKYGQAARTENGFFGKGFAFDGMGDYIEIVDNNSSLDFVSSDFYTWSFWLKYAGFANSSFGLLSKASGVNDSGFNFCLNTTGDNAFFVICKPVEDELQYSDSVCLNLSNNTWMLLTVVYNGSSGWDVYANGLKLDSLSFSVVSDLNVSYFLGAGRNATGDIAEMFFNGSFDDLVVFNRILVDAEICSLYNASAYQYSNNFTGLINGIYNFTGCAGYLTGDVDMTETRSVTIDTCPPVISNVSNTPDIVGFGGVIMFNADVAENGTGILMVMVNISYPDNTSGNYSLHCIGNDTYQCNFSDTWVVGRYNYTIWVLDNVGNKVCSNEKSFNVSAQATISVCTIKDEYGNNETINLTDPPGDPPLIGYELLDDGKVLRIWNNYDSYYFNTTSGIQLTNHYNEYWSHNVLMLGYYNNNQWNLIYRTDELSGFNKNIESDNETFVNATLWKDLTYLGYNFRLAIRYHLGVDDKELTVIPYIKNLGQAIPYTLGFAWELKDIQVDMTPCGDYIEINGTTYLLNQSLDETYKDMNQSCFYIREDISSDKSESLYLSWNDSLDYLIKVKSRDGQYNAPVTLGIKIGTLGVGQEKYTSLLWHDASQITYYFNSHSIGETWTTNPSYMVDSSTSTYASTNVDGDVELCDGNNCSGDYLGSISNVELRVCAYYTGSQRDTILRPVFNGTTDGLDYRYQTPPSIQSPWSPWFDITTDPFAPESWSWTDIENLDCDVEVGDGMFGFTLYCSKVEIRVTYTPEYPPGISDPVPADGSIGVSIAPLLNITVADPDGDNMNIIWLSNSSGSWQVFGTNNSVSNGTYHQTMVNASVNGQWWYWKVNVTDGTNYNESSVYKFYTGYESKINNTGSYHFKGYLLIQVQYYNMTSQSWVVADDTVNETSPRTVCWADPGGTPGQNILALDTIFNGLVNTQDLSGYGNGTYRVYACFRDPDGNVLVCNDDSLMEATYEFTVTFE